MKIIKLPRVKPFKNHLGGSFEVEDADRETRVFFLDLEMDGEAVLLSKAEYAEMKGQQPIPEKSEVNELAALPRAISMIKQAADILDKVQDAELQPSESKEIEPDMPNSAEAGQTVVDEGTDKGEGDINPLESKLGSQKIVGDYVNCGQCIKGSEKPFILKSGDICDAIEGCESPKKQPEPLDKPEDCPSKFDSLNLTCSECIEDCASRKEGE